MVDFIFLDVFLGEVVFCIIVVDILIIVMIGNFDEIMCNIVEKYLIIDYIIKENK